MPCYNRLRCFRTADGITFVSSHQISNLTLPCGQCWGCRLERSRQWALRCMHEAQLHKQNCFVTLTYNDENLPPFGSLRKRDHQLFLKRLRKAAWQGGDWLTPPLSPRDTHTRVSEYTANGREQLRGNPPYPRLRYYMAGEYGERLLRPHYHFCLFGIDFHDKKYLRRTAAGSKLYRSPTLEKLWTHGYSTVGQLTAESAAYTARYVMKKINGKQQEKHYERTDPVTGEIIHLQPEYNEMSRAEGIGKLWIEKFQDDVYRALPGQVVYKGKPTIAPRYYDKQLEKWDPERYEIIINQRSEKAKSNAHDNTPARLSVREQVARAKTRNLKRSI